MRLQSLLLLPALVRSAVAYTALSDDTLNALPAPGEDFDIHDGKLLAPILIPRVPGTKGSDEVLAFFVDFFTTNLPEWRLEFQNSTSTTPVSNGEEIPFRNLIATRDPPWAYDAGEVGRLALVAHFDSKLTPHNFIGATDSAAPCAMLLHAARSIDDALTRKWEAEKAEDGDMLDDIKGVQVILLDGEEAFRSWTDTDSLYGARALAEEWEQTYYSAMSTYSTPIASIDLFVLLDLLGSPPQTVPSYFKTTHWAYQHMADLETRLRKLEKFKSSPNHSSKRSPNEPRKKEGVFLTEADKKDGDRWIGGFIGDDHVPFIARGVEVLHIIPSPFPNVWHQIEDDGEHLDIDIVEDWAVLTTAFAAEWMDLEDFMEGGKKHVRTAGEDRVRDEL
jgi:glutaminyl-peptide cyclotransferase